MPNAAYIDAALTHDFVEDGDLASVTPNSVPVPTTLPNQVSVYDIEGRVTDLSTLTPVDPPAHADSFWTPREQEVNGETIGYGSDPYANDGLPAQNDFLQNQA